MKLAELEDPKKPMAILRYAEKHQFQAMEIHSVDETINLLHIINESFAFAKKHNCVEFCFKEILKQYNFKTDGEIWVVKLIGFRPLVKVDE